MEDEAACGSNAGLSKFLNDSDERPRSAVNSAVLDYYKKFGRKRDLEQYFSLTTAQSDIRDPRSLFWRRMKEHSDTSDSGDKKSESSNEICRISIKCSIPEIYETEKGESLSINESESPPIITDALPAPSPSGDESFDDNHSQKSADATLDTSMNKPLSPTSSITSQRKLEWDSLADVGYGNESDKKTSASSLSTLEREVLAQKQQYTLDFKPNSDLGLPTAHSTPVDPNESNPKGKKGLGKKTISISRKDVDMVEVNVPQNMDNRQPINVNLTKQFSVNLQKDGGMTIDNVKKDISISPEKNLPDVELNTGVKFDKEIQTSLLRSKDKKSTKCSERASTSAHKIPILIGLNSLRRRQRRKKLRKSRTKLKSKQKVIRRKEVVPEKDKSGEQVSEAESFEYMPGHMYNQNQLRKQDSNRSNNNNIHVGNKSSLESSAVHTTDSSKESKYSFSKDLDKTLNVLKSTLKEKYDSNMKKKLVTDIIHRLLKSNYGESESSPEFLSVLSLTSKKTPTTSTSEADNSEEKLVHSKPKKSILRNCKFDTLNVASTSQSAPNLVSVVDSDKPVTSYLSKLVSSTTTETDMSNNSAKDATSSDTVFAKTSSQELYKKYIDALKKEEAYKQHLRDKELFLKQKLVRSEAVRSVPNRLDLTKNTNLKDLIKDLTRNNYDDGSGDASILEGGSSSFDIIRQRGPRKQRSHSVFTLSSGNSDMQDRRNRLQKNKTNSPRAEPSNRDRNLAGSYNRPAVTDNSVQVNIKVHDNKSYDPPKIAEEENYVCLCTEKTLTCRRNPDEIEVFKCPISHPITVAKQGLSNRVACGIHSAGSSVKDENTKSCIKHPKTEKSVMECTRCVQTKFSVHPKIADPSETDLNIIDSAECVKLINELYRKVSKTRSECRCSNEKYGCNSYTCNSSKDNMRCNERDEQDDLIEDVNHMAPLTDQQTAEQNVIHSCVGCNKRFINQPESAADNIVIPIQGTNMMLKLSIDGRALKVQNKQTPQATVSQMNTLDKEMNTDIIRTSSRGMSIFDECSRSVQAENSNSKYKASYSPKMIKDKNTSPRNPLPSNSKTEDEIQRKNNYDFVSGSAPAVISTYPKKVQINEKKPLLRSNTDTGNLGASSGLSSKTDTRNLEASSALRSTTDTGNLDASSALRSNTDMENITASSRLRSNNEMGNVGASTGSRSNYDTGNFCMNSGSRSKTDTGNHGDSSGLRSNIDKGDFDASYGIQTETIYMKKKETVPCFRVETNQPSTSQKKSDSKGDGERQPLFIKTHSDQGDSESSKSSSGERFHSFNTSKNKYSADWQKLKEQKGYDNITDEGKPKDLILNVIKDITKRYSKKDTNKRSKKKCFKEILTALSYLLDTDDSGDGDQELLQSPKAVPYSKKDSSLTERFAGDFRKDVEGIKAFGGKSGTVPVLTANVFPQKSNTYERNMKTEPGSGSTQNRRFSEASGLRNRDHIIEQAPVKDPYIKNDSGAIGPKSPRSGKKAIKIDTNHEKPSCSKKLESYEFDSKMHNKPEKNRPRGNDYTKSTVPPIYVNSKSNESPRPKNKQSRSNSPKKIKTTCDRGCGCNGSLECKNCRVSGSPRCGGSDKSDNECMRPNQQRSRSNSPNKMKTTCDRGCGCDGSPECKNCRVSGLPRCGGNDRSDNECVRPNQQRSRSNSPSKDCRDSDSPKYSARSKQKGTICNSPKKTKTTCDRACSCDGSSGCMDCAAPHSPKYKNSPRRVSKPNPEVRCGSPKPRKTTCNGGCRSDDECDECAVRHSPRYRTGECGKDTRKPRNRCASPKNAKTCDRVCGCGASDCSECVNTRRSKYRTETCGKGSVMPKTRSRSASPKSPQPINKRCGCDDSSECTECAEPKSSKYATGKCAKKFVEPKKQDSCTSPRTSDTCDKCCGPDDTTGSSECVESQPSKYRNVGHSTEDRTNKKQDRSCSPINIKTSEKCSKYVILSDNNDSSKPKQKSRCNSPNKIQKMCNTSECKECNHQTGRWDKETCRSKGQDAKTFVNKCVQSTVKRVKSLYAYHCDDSSDIPVSTDPPHCSTDSPTSKFLHKIKTECDKYQKRCKACKKCGSSTTTVSCDHCRRAERHFRHHKCRGHKSKSKENSNKTCVAYNLIVQTSDSLISEEAVFDRYRPLQNVIVKVPKYKQAYVPFKEACAKIEKKLPYCDTRFEPKGRSQSWPNEISSTDDVKIANACTVRDYLEINRPDFVNNCETRQNCIRMTSESRAKERTELREQMVGLGSLPTLTDEELIYLAKQLGRRRKRPLQQKIMSEREMKKHSEKIYKSLPEVVQKKEDAKKENIKKTNLLLANLFKKNLQRKTLRGDVNIPHFSQVVKI